MNDELLFVGGLLLLLLGSGKKKDDDKRGPDTIAPTGPTPGPTPDDDLPQNPAMPDMVNPDGYPTAGTFYQVQQGDTMLGIAKRALTEAAFTAARNQLGLDDAAALEFASDFATGARQYAFLKAITCESWNDATVTTYGYGAQAVAGQAGRAVRLVPAHANNIQRLAQGMPAARRMHRGTPGDKANGVRRSGTGDELETLYIPAIDLAKIAEGKGLRLGGSKWPDGSSRIHPPKWVLALGVDDQTGTEPKGTKKRGCGASKVAIKVF